MDSLTCKDMDTTKCRAPTLVTHGDAIPQKTRISTSSHNCGASTSIHPGSPVRYIRSGDTPSANRGANALFYNGATVLDYSAYPTSAFYERGAQSIPVPEKSVEENAWGTTHPHAKPRTHLPKEHGAYTDINSRNKQLKQERHMRGRQRRHSE